jgi:hypothetical protein
VRHGAGPGSGRAGGGTGHRATGPASAGRRPDRTRAPRGRQSRGAGPCHLRTGVRRRRTRPDRAERGGRAASRHRSRSPRSGTAGPRTGLPVPFSRSGAAGSPTSPARTPRPRAVRRAATAPGRGHTPPGALLTSGAVPAPGAGPRTGSARPPPGCRPSSVPGRRAGSRSGPAPTGCRTERYDSLRPDRPGPWGRRYTGVPRPARVHRVMGPGGGAVRADGGRGSPGPGEGGRARQAARRKVSARAAGSRRRLVSPGECIKMSVVRPQGGPHGAWRVRMQGGRRSPCGASATDDNAAWGHHPGEAQGEGVPGVAGQTVI